MMDPLEMEVRETPVPYYPKASFGDYSGGRMPEPSVVEAFRGIVLSHYRAHGRSFPWRGETDPYRVVVSEIMLQQTQTSRVLSKYPEFLEAFPDVVSLSEAPIADLLSRWSGLGYNRRALALRETARIVVSRHGGIIPRTFDELTALPGIGKATAGAVLAYAFDAPCPFIETNIRRVFLHFFFEGRTGVADAEIFPILELASERQGPRRWFTALTDYGVLLREFVANPNRRSRNHRVQPKFEGSIREVRGEILRRCLDSEDHRIRVEDLPEGFGDRIAKAAEALAREGFIVMDGSEIRLKPSCDRGLGSCR